MRALGLDVGMKTIGVAASDALGTAAHGLETLERAGESADVARVVELVRSLPAAVVVVGLPLELSGARGRRALRVERFASALEAALGGDPPIDMWDERFSTAAAERALIAGGVSGRRRKAIVDRQAAAYILQGWLDARRSDEVPSEK